MSRSRRPLRWLTRLYPERFRDRFGEEMLGVLEDDLGSRETRGERAAFWGRSVLGVVRTAPAEHLADLGQDFKLVLRSARSRPFFFLISALSMGLGLGAMTTILATQQTVFLTPLAGVEAPERLINVKPWSTHQESFTSLSYPDYRDLVAGARHVEGITAFLGTSLVFQASADDEPQTQLAQATTSNFLEVVGVPVFLGRYFTETEERRRSATAFVSHKFWEERLGSPRTLPNLQINGQTFEIVGVGAPGFRGLLKGFPSDLYVPLGASESLGFPALDNRKARWLELVARLSPGAEPTTAAADFQRLGQLAASEHAELNRDLQIQIEATTGLDADYRRGLALFLSALLGVGALVLAISLLNVAGMMAARSADLEQSFAIRHALGAPRHRLARLVFVEALLLAVLSGGVGLAVAQVGVQRASSIFAAVDERIHLVVGLEPEAFVALLGLVVLVALLTASASGLTRLGNRGLKARGLLAARQRWRRALVVSQVVLSFVVLAAAALFTTVLQRSNDISLGFDPDPVAATSINARLATNGSDVLQEARRRVEALATIERAALTDRVPLSLGARFYPNRASVEITGLQAPDEAQGFAVEHSTVSAGYFETMSIDLLAGRDFTSTEAEGAPAAIVNQTFADHFLDGRALGREVVVNGETVEIVGICAPTKARTLDEVEVPLFYLSFEQQRPPRATLLAKASADPNAALPEIRDIQRSVAPGLPIQELGTLKDRLASALLPQRIAAAAAGTLGTLGLLLSATGLYGVLAHWVNSRTRELGLRGSLGAGPTDLLALVLRQGAGLTMLGIGLGIPIAAAVLFLMRGFLYGMSPLQPVVFVLAAAVLLAAGIAASVIPARRALGVSPLEALRDSCRVTDRVTLKREQLEG